MRKGLENRRKLPLIGAMEMFDAARAALTTTTGTKTTGD
jgi:hypothetical protein